MGDKQRSRQEAESDFTGQVRSTKLLPYHSDKLGVLSLSGNLPGPDGVTTVRQPYQLLKAPRPLIVHLLGDFKWQPLETYVRPTDRSRHRRGCIHIASGANGRASGFPVISRGSQEAVQAPEYARNHKR